MAAYIKPTLNKQHRETLLDIAKQSLSYGLQHGQALPVQPENFSEPLQKVRATFVTLNKEGELRGCIGTLGARQPLVASVAENAYAAGFRDPRFPAIEKSELPTLSLHISVLSAPEPMYFKSEEDLLEQIRPDTDGLILEDAGHRGTFLPSVWASLPDSISFLQRLKVKAGLTETYWSPSIRMHRYTTESFSSDQ